jgi:hypothetical protein
MNFKVICNKYKKPQARVSAFIKLALRKLECMPNFLLPKIQFTEEFMFHIKLKGIVVK